MANWRSIAISVVLVGLLWGFTPIPDVINQGASDLSSVRLPGAEPRPAPPTPSVDSEPVFDRGRLEGLVHAEVNRVRQNRGLDPLSFDAELVTIARYHSRDMATREYFAHVGPNGETMQDRYALFRYDCRVPIGGNRYATGGENVLYTYYRTGISGPEGPVTYETPKDLAEGMVSQWMHSPEHRENLLRSAWRREGIGVFVIEEEGRAKVYATQNFC
jgi:uncharacterized protein YkwD